MKRSIRRYYTLNRKEGGIVAYHGYQSFEEAEVSPELAHRIGVEFTQRVWGEDYQVLVVTHLNTDYTHNHAGAITDEDGGEYTPLDRLFARLELKEPDHIAVKYYKDYHSGSAKTLKSIHITLASRLEKFNLEGLRSLTMTDELELERMGERKAAGSCAFLYG